MNIKKNRQKNTMCVIGCPALKSFLKTIKNNGNIGDNPEFYYYFYNGSLGVSPNKPIGYTIVSFKQFKQNI